MRKTRKMATKDPPNGNRVSVDRQWLSVGLPVLAWVFTAGIGWNKLSYAEAAVTELKSKIEAVENSKYDTITKLVTVDNRLQELNRNLEKLSVQVETLAKAKFQAPN